MIYPADWLRLGRLRDRLASFWNSLGRRIGFVFSRQSMPPGNRRKSGEMTIDAGEITRKFPEGIFQRLRSIPSTGDRIGTQGRRGNRR
jgi:hypothetical protein